MSGEKRAEREEGRGKKESGVRISILLFGLVWKFREKIRMDYF